MKIIQGITPDEVVKRFGVPDRTSIRMMGTETDKPWQALEYVYVLGPSPYGEWDLIDNENSFYFDLSNNALVFWDIELAYPDSAPVNEIEEVEIEFYNRLYTGTTKNGRPQGNGEMKFQNGTVYTGDFQNGVLHGHGVITYLEGIKYEGQFVNGRAIDGYFSYEESDEIIRARMDENGKWMFMDENGEWIYKD
jgi:hypothetical protein